ncbi:hypothetical protein Pmani_035816 [Petrolisthes manimaculis]|uniref:Uncharacterized protein n=1 Tax=Petrolisthes manimaculis TaxID=1843537 RepID=A0AAE1TNB5_9EUCA|nr:hypothetical protein Pmani_035816 [Petrolisthes manimaculis]
MKITYQVKLKKRLREEGGKHEGNTRSEVGHKLRGGRRRGRREEEEERKKRGGRKEEEEEERKKRRGRREEEEEKRKKRVISRRISIRKERSKDERQEGR